MKKQNQLNNPPWLSNISENNMSVRCTFDLCVWLNFYK